MLKFDIKNRLKLDKKGNSKNIADSEKESEDNLKTEMIASLLKKGAKSNMAEDPVTFVDLDSNPIEQISESPTPQKQEQKIPEKPQVAVVKETLQAAIVKETLQTAIVEEKSKSQVVEQKLSEMKTTSTDSSKITQLIKSIENSEEKMISPFIDMNQGLIVYPILDQIGEEPTNLELLEKLASPSFDILEKVTYERLAVCPKHPESLAVNIRLYCPGCNSMDITKLHLIEHRRCGYISENTNFETEPDGSIKKCPSCKKEIRNMSKEIAMPAMWYTCNGCREKFDDVSIKLHCRKFNHDFDTNQSHTIVIPGFRLKNLADTSNSSISPILNQLKSLLKSYGFSAQENFNVTGKSGNPHRINIYGADEHKRTVFIFIKNPNADSDNSELNSKIIEVLDTSPSVAILIGFPSISEKAKSITSNYNISLVTNKDPQEILNSINKIMDEKLPKIES